MKIDQFQGNSNCEKSMKARTNLRPSMESLMPGLRFEKKLSKLVENWFTSEENATDNFFLGNPELYDNFPFDQQFEFTYCVLFGST